MAGRCLMHAHGFHCSTRGNIAMSRWHIHQCHSSAWQYSSSLSPSIPIHVIGLTAADFLCQPFTLLCLGSFDRSLPCRYAASEEDLIHQSLADLTNVASDGASAHDLGIRRCYQLSSQGGYTYPIEGLMTVKDPESPQSPRACSVVREGRI